MKKFVFVLGVAIFGLMVSGCADPAEGTQVVPQKPGNPAPAAPPNADPKMTPGANVPAEAQSKMPAAAPGVGGQK